MSLERELKRALRAQDPGEAFTARVLERIEHERAGTDGAKLDAAKADADAAGTAPTDITQLRGLRTESVPTEGGVHGVRPAPGVPLPQNVEPFIRRVSLSSPASSSVSSPAAPLSTTQTRRPRMLAWFAAMAATLTLTVGGAQWVKHRQEIAEGERARAEVLTALRLTSAKLSIVRAAIADPGNPREETAH